MNKKILALTIVAVIIIGGYAAFYGYESLYVIPGDVKVFKDELKSIQSNPITEKDITELENIADQIESGPSYKIIPQSERTKMANEIRNDPSFAEINKTINSLKENATKNREIASRYDLLLKFGVANDIRDIYSPELISVVEDMQKILEKIPTDFENGDNKALANDYRELARLGEELDKLLTEDEVKLESIINNLGG